MKRALAACFILLVFPTLLLAASKVDINNATLQQLDQLTGIGPVLAQKIINARPYYSVDELVKADGIGPKTLEKIKAQGLAYVTAEFQAAAPPPPAPTPAKPALLPKKALPKLQKTDNNANVALAATSEAASPTNNMSNPWLLFIIAGSAAIISGAAFLVFKLKK